MTDLRTLSGVRAAGLADGRARRLRAPVCQHVRWVWMFHVPGATTRDVVDACETYDQAWRNGRSA